MFQALGQFTVEWKKRGPLYYACWFPRSRDYFKCLKGLQGAEVVTAKKDDYGIIKVGTYIPFNRTMAIEKTTQEKMLELPRPFFVSQFLARENGLLQNNLYQEPQFQQRYNTQPKEKFVFPESEETPQN